MGYKFVKKILDERVEGAVPRDMIYVSNTHAKDLLLKYHICSIGGEGQYAIYNDSQMLRKTLKLMGVEEENEA